MRTPPSILPAGSGGFEASRIAYNTPMAPEADPQSDRFRSTHWSLVLAARDREAPQAEAALAELCRAYWYPLYGFIRRQGHAVEAAQDLTQEFFVRLMEKDFLAGVDRVQGRFRSYLLVACKHFLANEAAKARAQKRGGSAPSAIRRKPAGIQA